MSDFAKKFEAFECGCLLRRNCTQHGDIAALTEKLEECQRLKNFESAFAAKVSEFGTVERMVEEYSEMKQKHRQAEERIQSLEKDLENKR